MPKIRPDYDPFQRKTLYKTLKLDPFAPTHEIQIRLNEIEEGIEFLPEDEQKEQQTLLDKARSELLNPRRRALLNAVEMDPINRQHLVNMLMDLPEDRRVDKLCMPPLDLSQVLMEGESPEIAEVDFHDVMLERELEIDFSKVDEMLQALPEVRYFDFDS